VSIPKPDLRIKFNQTVRLPEPVAIVSAAVFGGPIIRLQVGVFDKNDVLLTGIGTNGIGQPITSEQGGEASWLFQVPATASYVKWGVQAAPSAAGLRAYSITGRIRSHNGDELAVGRFSAAIPVGASADEFIFDGAFVEIGSTSVAIPTGAVV
jgi:hypothetical protein